MAKFLTSLGQPDIPRLCEALWILEIRAGKPITTEACQVVCKRSGMALGPETLATIDQWLETMRAAWRRTTCQPLDRRKGGALPQSAGETLLAKSLVSEAEKGRPRRKRSSKVEEVLGKHKQSGWNYGLGCQPILKDVYYGDPKAGKTYGQLTPSKAAFWKSHYPLGKGPMVTPELLEKYQQMFQKYLKEHEALYDNAAQLPSHYQSKPLQYQPYDPETPDQPSNHLAVKKG